MEILAVEVMPEHVHLFVSAPPKFSPAEIVRLFKGITSRRLKEAFESLRRQYWGKNATLWAEGYYVGTAQRGNHQAVYRGKPEEIELCLEELEQPCYDDEHETDYPGQTAPHP